MAKKQEYSDIEKELDIQSFVQSIEEAFNEVPDPRQLDNQDYELTSLLVMILCAVIAGANSITAVHQYATLKIGIFQQLIGMTKPPCYMVFWWLLTRLEPQPLQDAFLKWISLLPPDIKAKLIAIDGKRLRGLLGEKGVHLVAAWESRRGMLLGQVKTAEKSNEITAIPELLETIDISGAVVTIDAAGCQRKIAGKIRGGGGDYMLALKGNQEILHEEAKNFFYQAREIGFIEDTYCTTAKTTEKGHGRIEEREVVVANNLDWLECRDEWMDIKSMIEVSSVRICGDKTAQEKRYYISSRVWTAEEAGAAIRSHWSIENHLHWSIDVVFCEDDGLANTGHAAENLAMFRRMALQLFREELGSGVGVAAKRREAAWDDSCALRVLGHLFRNGKSF